MLAMNESESLFDRLNGPVYCAGDRPECPDVYWEAMANQLFAIVSSSDAAMFDRFRPRASIETSFGYLRLVETSMKNDDSWKDRTSFPYDAFISNASDDPKLLSFTTELGRFKQFHRGSAYDGSVR